MTSVAVGERDAWRVVAGAFAIQFIVGGCGFYAFGVLLKPLAVALSANRFEISLAVTIQGVVAAVLGPALGVLLMRHSMRALMIGGAVVFAAGLFMLAEAQSLRDLYVAYGFVVAAGMTIAGPLPCAALVVEWFDERRGMALGISQLGATFGGSVFVPLATWMVDVHGWRAAANLFGALALLLLPTIMLLTVRRREAASGTAAPTPAPTLRDMLRQPMFWAIVCVFGFAFASLFAITQTLHSHVTDIGLSTTTAAAAVAVMTALGAAAKPLFGWLADHVGAKGATWLCLGLQIGGLLGLLGSDARPAVIASAAVFGLGYGGIAPLMAMLVSAAFGAHAIAKALGLLSACLLPFNLFGFPFATYMYERSGSYAPAFLSFVALCVLAAAALFAVKTSGVAHAGARVTPAV